MSDWDPRVEPRTYLFTMFMRELGKAVLDKKSDIISLDLEVIYAEIMLSDLIGEEDKEYHNEIQAVEKRYAPEKRDPKTHPKIWLAKLRLAQLRCIWRAACRHGIIASNPLDWAEGEL